MKLVKKIFDFYIKSSLHVALAIVSFVKVTELSLNISFSSHLILAIFFGSVVGYNFLKYEGFWLSKKFNFQKYIGVFFVTMVAFLFFVFYFFQLCRSQQVAFVSTAFLVLFYPFLRKYWFFKIGMVSFCVTFVVSCIPLLSASSMELSDTWFSLKLFVLIGALMLPFEIYDSQFDALTLQTIPQKFGVRKAKQMGYVFLLIFLLFASFHSKITLFLIDLFIAVLVGISIYFASVKNSKYYTSFWVEAIPIFWWMLLLFLSC